MGRSRWAWPPCLKADLGSLGAGVEVFPVGCEGDGLLNSPPKCSHDAPQNLEYGTYHGKRVFADGIRVKTVRWGDWPGLSTWVQVVTRILIRGRQESQRGRGQAKSGVTKDMSRGTWAPLEAGRDKEMDLQKEPRPANPF